MATKPKEIIARIKDNDIEWVDLRFTDPKGKWQHRRQWIGCEVCSDCRIIGCGMGKRFRSELLPKLRCHLPRA